MAFVYSCCFWFSLRLGGILIGIFSLLQSVVILIAAAIAQSHMQSVQDMISNWITSMRLGYLKTYFEYLRDDPEKYMTILITLTSFYIILCLLFIYGAYTCNNSLMIGYLLVEVLRLGVISFLEITWLLLLKENTLDIGLLIGASVAGGFGLLGMFYLWVCAANLPILINEMEREEQTETIAKLRRQLEKKEIRAAHVDPDDLPRFENTFNNVDVYTVPRNNLQYNDFRNPFPYTNNNNYGVNRYF